MSAILSSKLVTAGWAFVSAGLATSMTGPLSVQTFFLAAAVHFAGAAAVSWVSQSKGGG